MITDVELCREIPFRYAKEPYYPSRIQLEDLYSIYSDQSEDEILFNVLALKDAELMHARIELMVGADLHAGVKDLGITSLTPHLGFEFVHHARSDNLWKSATKKFGDAGMNAAPSRMFEVLTSLPLKK